MNEYFIHTTSQFNEEFDRIYHYINFYLHSPRAANKFYFKIKKSILSLNFFPERFPKVPSVNYQNHNLRKLIIDKYIIIYEVQNNSNEVFILHIFHGSQNYLTRL